MTVYDSTGPATDFTSYIQSLTDTSTANHDPAPKINQQGQMDIYGIGENSGVNFALGTVLSGPNDPNAGDTPREIHDRPHVPEISSTTTDDYWKQLLVMSQTDPQQFIQIQQGLYESGYYGNVKPTDVRFGIAGQKTKDALFGADGAITQYLEATRGGATVDTFNDWLKKQTAAAKADPYSVGNGGGAAGTGSGTSTKTFNPSSPDLISQNADSEGQTLLGHGLGQDETDQIIGQVQGQEQKAYEGGDYLLRGVTPASLARDFIVQNNLPEYSQHQAESYMNVFANMFLNGNSQRSQTSLGDVAIGDTAPTNGGQ